MSAADVRGGVGHILCSSVCLCPGAAFPGQVCCPGRLELPFTQSRTFFRLLHTGTTELCPPPPHLYFPSGGEIWEQVLTSLIFPTKLYAQVSCLWAQRVEPVGGAHIQHRGGSGLGATGEEHEPGPLGNSGVGSPPAFRGVLDLTAM